MEIHDFDDDHLQSVLKEEEEEDDDNYVKEDTPIQFSAATLGNSLMQSPGSLSKIHTLEGRRKQIGGESGIFSSQVPSHELKIENCIQIDSLTQTAETPEIGSSKANAKTYVNNNQGGKEETDFSLSDYELGFIPDGMVTPSSQRINDIIRMTSVRTSAVPQFEVLLKLKQSDNKEFEFLKAEHKYNPYYLFLKDRGGEIDKPVMLNKQKYNQAEMSDEKSGNEDDKEDDNETSGIGGLLGMYASSSDDDDESPCKECSNAATPSKVSDNNQVSTISAIDTSINATTHNEDEESSSNIDDQRKAKRLKRARNLKGHFALKLMENKM